VPLNPKTFKSLEFIVFALVTVGAWLGTLTDTVSPHTAVFTTAISASLYAVGRGLAKANTDVKDFWQTTEFWSLVLGTAVSVVGYWQDVIGPATTQRITQFLLLGIAIMAYRKDPAVASGLAPAPAPHLDGNDQAAVRLEQPRG
jgi:hypothetical protein